MSDLAITSDETVAILTARLRRHVECGDKVVVTEQAVTAPCDHFGVISQEPTGETRYVVTVIPRENIRE